MSSRVGSSRLITPFVIALLLGGLGWLLVQFSDRMLEDSRQLTVAQAVLESADSGTGGSDAGLEEALETAQRNTRSLLLAVSVGLPLGLLLLVGGWLSLRQQIESREVAEAESAAAQERLLASVEQSTRLSREMQRLSAYASLLQTCDSIEEVLDVTCVCLVAMFPEAGGVVYLHHEGQVEARIETCWGDQRLQTADRLAPDDCWGLRRAQPFPTDSSTASVRCAHILNDGDDGPVATLCLPLSAHGTVLGLLYLNAPEPMRGEHLAATAAEQLSLALSNLKMRESLRDQSLRDPLTGLHNRRRLDSALLTEFDRCRQLHKSLALLMLDVDHFKPFNDRHGHPGGDAMLTALGALLRDSGRGDELAFRYGGEEFTILLPETERAEALARAEEIRLAVSNLQIEHDGEILQRVSVSIGVAVTPGCADNIDDLVESADRALFRAKEQGRNRTVAASFDSDNSRPEAGSRL